MGILENYKKGKKPQGKHRTAINKHMMELHNHKELERAYNKVVKNYNPEAEEIKIPFAKKREPKFNIYVGSLAEYEAYEKWFKKLFKE